MTDEARSPPQRRPAAAVIARLLTGKVTQPVPGRSRVVRTAAGSFVLLERPHRARRPHQPPGRAHGADAT